MFARKERANGTLEEADLTLRKYLKQSGRSSRDFKLRTSYTAESGTARLHATLEHVAPPDPELTRAAQESNPFRDERLNFSISRDSTPLVWVWCCKCGSVLREPAALSADTLAISFHRFVALMLGADGVPETQRHVLPCCGSNLSTHAMWFVCRSPLQASRGVDGASSGIGLLDGGHHHHHGNGSIFGGGAGGDHPRWLLTRFEHEGALFISVVCFFCLLLMYSLLCSFFCLLYESDAAVRRPERRRPQRGPPGARADARGGGRALRRARARDGADG